MDKLYSKTEIDSTLSDYTTSAQLHTDCYSKVKPNIMFDTYTTTTQLYDDFFYSKGYVNQMLVQSTTLFDFYYTKGDIDTLSADKVSNIGDISLPGMLDIGTSAYTNSSIRCNAEVGGCTGYAELQAASSYDMFLDLSTTRTGGGWMCFKINNDDYIQLPSSDNKVNIYKTTAISINLDVGTTQTQTSIKTYVNHAGHQGNVDIEAMWSTQAYINFNTTASDGLLFTATKDVIYMHCGLDIVYFYKPTTNASDDRLKENEELTENACEALSKLRPQLYDKKPDMENNDPTTWYK